MLAIKSMRIAINKWQTPRPGAGNPPSSYGNVFAMMRIKMMNKSAQ